MGIMRLVCGSHEAGVCLNKEVWVWCLQAPGDSLFGEFMRIFHACRTSSLSLCFRVPFPSLDSWTIRLLSSPISTSSTCTLRLIYRSVLAFFFLCKMADQVLKISGQVLEPLRNGVSSKNDAVESANSYLGGAWEGRE